MNLRKFRERTTYACVSGANARECPRGVTILADRLEEIVKAAFLDVVGDWPLVIFEDSVSAEAVKVLALTEETLDSIMARIRFVDDEGEEAALLAKRRKIRAALPGLLEAAKATAPRAIETGLTYREDGTSATLPGVALDDLGGARRPLDLVRRR